MRNPVERSASSCVHVPSQARSVPSKFTIRIRLPSCSILLIVLGEGSERGPRLLRFPGLGSLPGLGIVLEEIRFNHLFLRLLFKLWKLFHSWRNHSTSPGPFLVDQKLDHSSDRPEGYPFNCGVEESEDDHPLSLAVSQTS